MYEHLRQKLLAALFLGWNSSVAVYLREDMDGEC